MRNTVPSAKCNPGRNGGTVAGGRIFFVSNSASPAGGNATVQLNGNGALDVSSCAISGIAIGSLAGDGQVYLGAHKLTAGREHNSTAFGDSIQDGGDGGGTGGALAKVGSGTFALIGGHTYTA